MNNIKVSILVPSLNVGQFIEECIESIISQTLHDIEIICIDAGSTDGTLEILEKYAAKDNRIKIIHSPVKSYGYQMNIGINTAKGEYIGIVETDDYISADMFERLYAYASECEVDFVKSRYTEFGGKGEKRRFYYVCKPIISEVTGKNIELNKHNELRLCDVNHIWSGLYKRAFLISNKIRFNETPGASFQDTSFSVLVGCLAKRCIYTTDSFYFYRIDNCNSSVKQSSKIRCIVDEFDYIRSELEKRKLYTKEFESAICNLKLFLYCWNYKRLTDNAREEFLEIISEEMSEYNADKFPFIEEPDKVLELAMLTGKYRNNTSNEDSTYEIEKISTAVKAGKRFCVVGAGNYGRYVCFINKQFGLDFIDGFADNSEKLHGTDICGYTITSVNDAAAAHKNSEWLIAVKNHSNEIIRQLNSFGITDEHIYIISNQLSFSQLFSYFG